LIVAGPASAAEDTAWGRDHGWSLGLHIVSDHIGAEDPGSASPPEAVFVDETGGGALVSVGYAFTPSFALRFVGGSARHETTRDGVEVNHASATIEAHFRFLPGERAQPYLFGGIGGATLRFDSEALDSKVEGGLAVIGAGAIYRLTRHLSLDLAGRFDLINWNTIEVTAELPGGGELRLEDPVDESGSGKILFGVVWNF
jgi:opacity protein-like surface antigen